MDGSAAELAHHARAHKECAAPTGACTRCTCQPLVVATACMASGRLHLASMHHRAWCARIYAATSSIAAEAFELEATFLASPQGPCTALAWRPCSSQGTPPMMVVGSPGGARVRMICFRLGCAHTCLRDTWQLTCAGPDCMVGQQPGSAEDCME